MGRGRKGETSRTEGVAYSALALPLGGLLAGAAAAVAAAFFLSSASWARSANRARLSSRRSWQDFMPGSNLTC